MLLGKMKKRSALDNQNIHFTCASIPPVWWVFPLSQNFFANCLDLPWITQVCIGMEVQGSQNG